MNVRACACLCRSSREASFACRYQISLHWFSYQTPNQNQIFASEKVSEMFLCRLLGRVAVKGKTQGVDIHEVIDLRSEVDGDRIAAAELYSSAVSLVHCRQFRTALETFQQ